MEQQFTLFTLEPGLMNKRRRRDAPASYTSDIWDIENLDRIIENFLSEEATDESVKSDLSNSGLSDQDHVEEVISPQKRNTPQIMDDPGKDKIQKEIQEKFVLKDVYLESLEDVTNFVILLALLSPDRIFKIKRSEVITRSDTYRSEVNIYFELKVNIYFELSGTRVSHWTSIEVGEFLLSLRERHHLSRQKLIEQFYASLPRLKVPGPFASEGKFTLNIENGRDDLRITNIISDSVTLVYK
eukprot:gene8058-8709_t